MLKRAFISLFMLLPLALCISLFDFLLRWRPVCVQLTSTTTELGNSITCFSFHLQLIGVDECLRRIDGLATEVKRQAGLPEDTTLKGLVLLTSCYCCYLPLCAFSIGNIQFKHHRVDGFSGLNVQLWSKIVLSPPSFLFSSPFVCVFVGYNPCSLIIY